jgi:hypothetical protein
MGDLRSAGRVLKGPNQVRFAVSCAIHALFLLGFASLICLWLVIYEISTVFLVDEPLKSPENDLNENCMKWLKIGRNC